MLYKIIKDVDISGKKKGDIIEAEPHAMELYLKKKEVEKVKEETKKENALSEREQIKKELTEKKIEFRGNAKTEVLKELNK